MSEREAILAALRASFEALEVLLTEHCQGLSTAHLDAVIACRGRLAMVLAEMVRR